MENPLVIDPFPIASAAVTIYYDYWTTQRNSICQLSMKQKGPKQFFYNWISMNKAVKLPKKKRDYVLQTKKVLGIVDGKQQSHSIQSLQPASTDNSSYQNKKWVFPESNN